MFGFFGYSGILWARFFVFCFFFLSFLFFLIGCYFLWFFLSPKAKAMIQSCVMFSYSASRVSFCIILTRMCCDPEPTMSFSKRPLRALFSVYVRGPQPWVVVACCPSHVFLCPMGSQSLPASGSAFVHFLSSSPKSSVPKQG